MTVIPSLANGVVLSAGAEFSLVPLNVQVGLFGINGALDGSPPPTDSPAFFIVTGFVAIAVSAANFDFNLSPGFPNGCVAILMQPVTGSGNVDEITVGTPVGNQINGQYFNNGSPFSGTTEVVYIAFGF